MASSKQKTPDEFFEELVTEWRRSARTLSEAELKYSIAYGRALTEAEGKTAEIREAAAVSKVTILRGARDIARIDEQALRWAVQYHLARAGRTGRFE